jgi:hypothetical protein
MVSIPRTLLEMTVTSLDTVETRRVRGLARWRRINFAKSIRNTYAYGAWTRAGVSSRREREMSKAREQTGHPRPSFGQFVKFP